jgi:Family of unknown function (DUF5670)
MFASIAVLFIVLWLFGLFADLTMGGFIHILLVMAVIVLLLEFFQRRRA